MLSVVQTLHSPLHHHRPFKPTHHRPHIPLITPRFYTHKLTPSPLPKITAPNTLRPHILILRAAADADAVPGPDDGPSTVVEHVDKAQESQPKTSNNTSPPIAPPPAQKKETQDETKTSEVVVKEEEEEEEEDNEEPSDLKNAPVSETAKKEEGVVKKKKEVEVTKKKNNNNKSSTLHLGVVFGMWYFQNVIFNIYNKKVLNLFPYPWLLASFQLLFGSLWMSALWATGIQPRPRASRRFLAALLGPALFHAIGHISACVSFANAAVSFTHVIKSAEPAFSVALSALHGHFYPVHVWLAVLPIIAGCSLAAVTEVSFSPAGLWGALISNIGFVLRNIYSKQSLYNFKHVDGLNLYGCISIISLLYLFPVAVIIEGSQWVEGFRRAVAAVPTPWTFYGWVIVSGVFYHLYNQSSYQALDRISPLTFSVGNTMKRVVVIIASVLVFRNPIRPLNALGSGIAILGTFLYSQATAVGKNKKNNEVAMKKS